MAEVFSIIKSGKTLLVSTHVMDEVYKCNRAILLYNGNLIENDTIENLLKKPQMVKWTRYF